MTKIMRQMFTQVVPRLILTDCSTKAEVLRPRTRSDLLQKSRGCGPVDQATA